MDEEWDNEDFQPKEINIPEAVLANKWEGEDEDDQVKDNWEDEEEEEEEEKKDVEKQEAQQTQPSKKGKKALLEKIEEKELRKREEAQKKQAVMETQKELTPEEIAAEKLRQQKLQEESDLLIAKETFGVTIDPNATGIDAMNPITKEEFDEFQDALSKKFWLYTKSPHFPGFAEEFIRNICVNLSSYDLKKLKMTIENMFLEKTKVEKGDKAKKKGKTKAKLKVEGENALVNEYSAYDMDDYDDFM
ncbi:LOW QUALITY PROTEIN: eukaryotic translation initiation factor 3 subunit J [Bacillus rossius redtenbacheri]|uniref:LOW QUALITY PROTEIN: eukaryotic translation initiation factor 3 subunit J n=1 Tax=Bacillus rossius redtenbacheri TaxID=93214 RepID=UPI002FDE5257